MGALQGGHGRRFSISNKISCLISFWIFYYACEITWGAMWCIDFFFKCLISFWIFYYACEITWGVMWCIDFFFKMFNFLLNILLCMWNHMGSHVMYRFFKKNLI
jgi:hypothetical protein